MAKMAKRLFDLEIDEISVVDRAANQHALVAIAKRAEAPDMALFDVDGNEVEETDLDIGELVYNEAGEEFVYLDDEAAAQLGINDGDTSSELDEDYANDALEEGYVDDQLVGVGKALPSPSAVQNAGWRAGNAARRTVSRGRQLGAQAGRTAVRYMPDKNTTIVGGAAAGTGGLGFATGNRRGRQVRKSLGNEVLEELSKALNDNDRDEVIAKAMDYVEVAKAEAHQARQLAQSLIDERDESGYVELAAGYNLPVDPTVLGSIMKRAADTLPDRDVAVLDRIFSSVGEQLYSELGSNGSRQYSMVMDEVEALANEAVGKSGGISSEQAVVALFESNPQAYDEYMSEQR